MLQEHDMSYPPRDWNDAKIMYGSITESIAQWPDKFTLAVFRCIIFKFDFSNKDILCFSLLCTLSPSHFTELNQELDKPRP